MKNIKKFMAFVSVVSIFCASAFASFAGTDLGSCGHEEYESNFSVKETEAPQPETIPTKVKIKNDQLNIDLENTVDYVDVEGQKYWVGDTGLEENRPEQITVHLYADGEDTGNSTTTNQDKEWKYSFTNLDRYKDGIEIVYSVVEDVPDKYTVSYGDLQLQENEDKNSIITLNITNTYYPTIQRLDFPTPELEEEKAYVDIGGHKTWNDNDDRQGMRPDEIKVHLYADDVDTGYSVTLSEADGWNYKFEDFPKYDYEGDGHEIEYSIKEDVPKGYSVEYTTVEKEATPPTEMTKQ